MNLTVLTLFPEVLRGYFDGSIMARAIQRGLVSVRLVDIRDYATDRHRTVDDAPYGGGAGMVLMPEPLSRAIESVRSEQSRVIYPTPSGRPFTAHLAQELAAERDLVMICGRYEGIDQRVIDGYVDDEICIGDYVLSSGEVATMVVVDAVYRFIEGVLSRDSLAEESFRNGLLEYPHYTRPEEFNGMRVPEVLLSGHHERIRRWRLRRQVEKTERNRPDLVAGLGDSYRKIQEELRRDEEE
jgi:tRNA (guanine37-N1)-methyltransferase